MKGCPLSAPQTKCPPREVRNFRVIIVKDAYPGTRGGNDSRQAQLTVWDVLNLTIAEGSNTGDFKVGQRFLVSYFQRSSGTCLIICARSQTYCPSKCLLG